MITCLQGKSLLFLSYQDKRLRRKKRISSLLNLWIEDGSASLFSSCNCLLSLLTAVLLAPEKKKQKKPTVQMRYLYQEENKALLLLP